MKTAFIFGLGYVGLPLAQALAEKGWQIRGTTRTPSKLIGKIGIGWEILSFAAKKYFLSLRDNLATSFFCIIVSSICIPIVLGSNVISTPVPNLEAEVQCDSIMQTNIILINFIF